MSVKVVQYAMKNISIFEKIYMKVLLIVDFQMADGGFEPLTFGL